MKSVWNNPKSRERAIRMASFDVRHGKAVHVAIEEALNLYTNGSKMSARAHVLFVAAVDKDIKGVH